MFSNESYAKARTMDYRWTMSVRKSWRSQHRTGGSIVVSIYIYVCFAFRRCHAWRWSVYLAASAERSSVAQIAGIVHIAFLEFLKQYWNRLETSSLPKLCQIVFGRRSAWHSGTEDVVFVMGRWLVRIKTRLDFVSSYRSQHHTSRWVYIKKKKI